MANRLALLAVLGIGLTTNLWLLGSLAPAKSEKAVLVIHGGAGVDEVVKTSPALEKRARDTLDQALRAGYAVLQKDGGTSLDAVEAALKSLEDSGEFNAGKGAVFTREGRNELDAAIMDGKTKRAGAVAGVTRTRNPISAARAVMDKSEHVFLAGDGADRFAASVGLPAVSPLFFWSERRWKELDEKKKAEEQKQEGRGALLDDRLPHFGTVGCVAVDRAGNLAAGTSTGGLTYKRPGRVGDSPLIGAGTYADNASCAVSCTGAGEVFIRASAAHEISARMRFLKAGVREASEQVLNDLPSPKGGVGGVIALDREGNFAYPFNTDGMYRGYVTADGTVHVLIWGDK